MNYTIEVFCVGEDGQEVKEVFKNLIAIENPPNNLTIGNYVIKRVSTSYDLTTKVSSVNYHIGFIEALYEFNEVCDLLIKSGWTLI